MHGEVREGRSGTALRGVAADGDVVSSVGELLHHVEEEGANDELSDYTARMREHVATFYGRDSGEVYRSNGSSGLRNTWSHGDERSKAETGRC